MPIRDEDGHRAMQAAGKAWNAIKTSGAKTWMEWTEVIGPGLVNARAEAQSISNASSGKGYNAAMGALLALSPPTPPLRTGPEAVAFLLSGYPSRRGRRHSECRPTSFKMINLHRSWCRLRGALK
jgi:hypothetical protein